MSHKEIGAAFCSYPVPRRCFNVLPPLLFSPYPQPDSRLFEPLMEGRLFDRSRSPLSLTGFFTLCELHLKEMNVPTGLGSG